MRFTSSARSSTMEMLYGSVIFLLFIAGSYGATQGREFVVAFYEHFRSGHLPEISFIILSETTTTVNIKSVGFSIDQNVAVDGMVEQKYETNADNFYQANLAVTDMTFYITSPVDITLFCYNYMVTRGDGFLALPVPELSLRYILVSHTNFYRTSSLSGSLLYTGAAQTVFLIIATQDNTQVTINLKLSGTYASGGCGDGTFFNGESRTFSLNKHQVVGAYCHDDITGTVVDSDKPVAVLSGHNYNEVVVGESSDHLTEMLLPVDSLGRNYVLTEPPQQPLGAFYRVVASEASTGIRSSTGLVFSLDEGEAYDVTVNSTTGPMFLKANKPIMVVQFSKSTGSMTLVPSTSQYSDTYDVARALLHPSFPSGELKYYYITVTVSTDRVLGMRPEIFPQFEVIKGTCFSFATLELSVGYHRLSHVDGVPFGMIVYLVGAWNGYFSHPGGFYFTQLVDRNTCPGSGICSDGVPSPCSCTTGYFEYTCNDTSPGCSSTPCHYSSPCTDDINRYMCACVNGSGGAHCEHDTNDDCVGNDCINGTCVDHLQTYSCDCALGFSGGFCETNIDDCAVDLCVHGTCKDQVNNFTCQCDAGYTGWTCDTDIDDCLSTPCINGGTCHDFLNFYNCSCVPGYEGINCEIDIDECSSHPCVNGTCNNFVNMYNCTCIPGFEGVNCDTETNECETGPCMNGGSCTDLINAFECSCPPGFNGTICENDIDDCFYNPCQNSGICNDFPNFYNCSCALGYEGMNCETDINECANNPCINGTCNNLVNMYNCTCTPGFEGVNCDTETNECDTGPCMNGGSCTDLLNAFECSCPPGFNGAMCENDVDECVSDPCQNGGVCNDFPNSYNCSCVPGYEGTNCETDINECANNPCINGTCNNLVNMYNCTCTPGFEGVNCDTETNECSTSPCMNGGSCIDLLNAFECSCPPGFNGTICENDVDECVSDPCQNGGVCYDFPNSYNCSCVPGYEGTNCETDIDECSSDPCISGTCNNLINMYNCTCIPGFEGVNCDTDIDECISNPCLNGNCTNAINMYSCGCYPGYKGVNCDAEIDECASNPCLNNGNCTDILNGFICTCPDGINGTRCEIGGDPCAASPCQNNGTCTQTPAGFNCSCPPGIVGESCETDIDDCASAPCQNAGTCIDKVNAFDCLCPANSSGILCEFLLSCGCPCLLGNISDAELAAKIALLRSILLVDKSTLSSTIRKKISVPDHRPSSTGIGFSGVSCLVIAFGFFVLMDGLNLVKFAFTKPTPKRNSETKNSNNKTENGGKDV